MERDKKEKFQMTSWLTGSQKSILECSRNAVDYIYLLHEFDPEVFDNIQYSGKKLELIEFSKSKEQNSIEIAEYFIEDNMNDLIKWTYYDSKPDINTIKDYTGCLNRFWGHYGTNKQIKVDMNDGGFNRVNNYTMINIYPKFIPKDFDWYSDLLKKTTEHLNPRITQLTEYQFNRGLDSKSDEIGTGWMIYVSDDFIDVKIENEALRYELFNNGKIFITTEEEFSKNNPIHVEQALKLSGFFNKNEYFRPTYQ